jgi:endoglucanase
MNGLLKYSSSVRILTLAAAILGVAMAQPQGAYSGKPFQGKAQVIPGRVQMEFYDTGGQGVAYNDTDAVNNGSGKLNKDDTYVDRFRQDEGVDLSYTKLTIDRTVDGVQETVNELYIGWTAPGEWVNYTVDVKEAGTYVVSAHMTSRTDAAQISLSFDGVDKTGPILLPTTTHWHLWRIAPNLATVKLEKGIQVMRLSVLKEGNFNIDYLEFTPQGAAATSSAGATAVPVYDQIKQMGRGLNIIGYDPLWKDPSKARFQDRHFQRIREGGFQTVRMNLHAFAHMNAENQLSASWFKTLDWAVNAALANNLIVILDEHNFTGCGQDAEGCRTKLLAFWTQVAEHYKDAPPAVIFEILNEPNGKLTPELWNSYLLEALAIIRKSNPTRNVIIGPGLWNGFRALDQLKLPADDHHIIVTVHYYVPMEFTHQGAPWNKQTVNLSGVTWGTDEDKRRVDTDFAVIQKWSQANGRPILLGEFGAYDKAPMDSRVNYTAYLARAAEALGWAWTYWQFDSDFIAYDISKDEWVAPIHSALVP